MVTPVVEASGEKGPGSGSASKQALRQVNAEQSLETGNADAELVREKRSPLSPWEGEQYVHWGEPPGYWARACVQRTMHQHGRPIWPGVRVSPERTDRCPARGRSGAGWESDRPEVPENSEKVRGREGALVQGKRTKEREHGDWRHAYNLPCGFRGSRGRCRRKRRQVRPHPPREMYAELTVGIILRQPCPEAECGKSACSV